MNIDEIVYKTHIISTIVDSSRPALLPAGTYRVAEVQWMNLYKHFRQITEQYCDKLPSNITINNRIKQPQITEKPKKTKARWSICYPY